MDLAVKEEMIHVLADQQSATNATESDRVTFPLKSAFLFPRHALGAIQGASCGSSMIGKIFCDYGSHDLD